MRLGQAFAVPVKAPSMKRIKLAMARLGLFIDGHWGQGDRCIGTRRGTRGRLRAGGGIGEMRPMRLP